MSAPPVKEYKYNPTNPSPSACAKVKDPLPVPDYCPECGGKVRIGSHAEVYEGRSFGVWPYVYICDGCKRYVGMHNFTNIPLGYLADEETRQARVKSKPWFEKLWKNGYMKRDEAYRWLASQLNINPVACHFGMFDKDRCYLARDICKRKIKEYENDRVQN